MEKNRGEERRGEDRTGEKRRRQKSGGEDRRGEERRPKTSGAERRDWTAACALPSARPTPAPRRLSDSGWPQACPSTPLLFCPPLSSPLLSHPPPPRAGPPSRGGRAGQADVPASRRGTVPASR